MGTDERSAIFNNTGIYESTPELRARYNTMQKKRKAINKKRLLEHQAAQRHFQRLIEG